MMAKRKSVPLRAAQYNPGQATMPSEMGAFVRKFWPALLTMQEMSDRDDLVEALVNEGYGHVRGDGHPGQKATAVFYRLAVTLRLDHHRIGLTKQGTVLGDGTGPDDGKAKDLKAVVLEHLPTGRNVQVATLHPYAGQHWSGRDHQTPGNERARISRDRIVWPSARWLVSEHPRMVTLLGMDGNAAPDRGLYVELRKRGFVCNHDELGVLPTHVPGHWSPDMFWVRDVGPHRGRLTWVKHQVVQPKRKDVDHRALVVDFELTERVR